jgi:microcystin-dependent protein
MSNPFVGEIRMFAGNFAPRGWAFCEGQLLAISQNDALFALLGTTYGGDGRMSFNVPDLRGRIIVGSGASPTTGVNLQPGDYGGMATVTLKTTNLPTHAHALSSGYARATASLGSLAASTSMSGLSATTTLSDLALKASTGGTLTNVPDGRTLATAGGTTRVYSDAAPSVAMKAGSITGTATTTVKGNPTTTLSGAPSVALSGTTDQGGGVPSPVAVLNMQPYVSMYYYIAAQGLFPSFD